METQKMAERHSLITLRWMLLTLHPILRNHLGLTEQGDMANNLMEMKHILKLA